MSESPYILPQLAATRAGVPDPLIEIDLWLSRLRELLDAGVETADEAYDLLALWARMRRVRPELASQLAGDEVLTQVDALLADRGQHFATEAMTIPNPQAWIEEAEGLERAFEEPGTLESRSGLAECLLTDLDDAKLVLYASRRFGVDDRELEAELALCQQWLAEHLGLFLVASVYVQAVGMTFRPNLAEFDYGLAVTALKYVDLLHAAEAAERELSLADVQQFDPVVVQQLAARLRQERAISSAQMAFLTIARILLGRMRQIPLARASEAEALEPLWWWKWCSPAGDLVASLTIPPQPAPDEDVVLEFVGPDQRRATELAGQTVSLHGVEATIDPQARATFPLARLLQTEMPLILRVGPNQAQWRLTAAHADT